MQLAPFQQLFATLNLEICYIKRYNLFFKNLIMAKKDKKITGELIFGIHPITELLKAKRRKLLTIYTIKPLPKGWKQIEECLPKYHVPIQYVARDVLHRMAGTTDHQGVIAWVQLFPFRKKFFDPKKQASLVMLDGIQDPRNVGAILRSAYCTGIDGVLLIKKKAAPLSPAAIKAAAGLSEYLEIFLAPSTEWAAQELKKHGYHLYLATFDGENATECNYKKPFCLVIGSESVGISKTIYQTGTHITLPQRSPDISYNASVAAGILLFLIATKSGNL